MHRFSLGSPLRAGLGLLLVTASAAVLWTSRTIELGIAWTAVIPAVVLLIPALGLLQRRVLTTDGEKLTITSGWLWQRAMDLPLREAELEVLPTAGLVAVVLHRHGQAWPLATWILPATARRLTGWLDGLSATGALPRRAVALPSGDR
jgi:hypothetical protein